MADDVSEWLILIADVWYLVNSVYRYRIHLVYVNVVCCTHPLNANPWMAYLHTWLSEAQQWGVSYVGNKNTLGVIQYNKPITFTIKLFLI